MYDDQGKRAQEGAQPFQIPPQNLAAERCVLGACLISPASGLARALTLLSPGDFYRPAHRVIFEALGRLFSENIPIDLTILAEHLTKTGKLEEAGGQTYLVSLMQDAATDKNLPYHCKIVKDKSDRRKLISWALRAQSEAYSGFEDTYKLISQTGEQLFALARGDAESHRTARLDFDNYVQRHLGAGGLSFGVAELDRMTGGMSPGNLILLEAREKVGKTAFAMHIARHTAKADKKVLFFSLEMLQHEMIMRTIASETRIPSLHIKTGRTTSAEGMAYNTFDASEAKKLLMENFLVDDRKVDQTNFSAVVRLHAQQHKLSLIILDYLTLFVPMKPEEIINSVRLFKAIAKDLEVPFICLAQRSRPEKGMANPRPQPTDTLGAGVERDCDMLIFLYNPAAHLFDAPINTLDFRQQNLVTEWKKKVEGILTYDRAGGGRGTFEMMFDRECGWFGNLSDRVDNAQEPPF